MERGSVGKRGEGEESVSDRGGREFIGLCGGQFTGELVPYIKTDAPAVTESSRMFTLLAHNT